MDYTVITKIIENTGASEEYSSRGDVLSMKSKINFSEVDYDSDSDLDEFLNKFSSYVGKSEPEEENEEENEEKKEEKEPEEENVKEIEEDELSLDGDIVKEIDENEVEHETDHEVEYEVNNELEVVEPDYDESLPVDGGVQSSVKRKSSKRPVKKVNRNKPKSEPEPILEIESQPVFQEDIEQKADAEKSEDLNLDEVHEEDELLKETEFDTKGKEMSQLAEQVKTSDTVPVMPKKFEKSEESYKDINELVNKYKEVLQ